MLPTKKTGFKLNPFLCALLPLTMHGIAIALPTNGAPTDNGAASISTNQELGFVLVEQTAQNVLINWTEFGTRPGEVVEFRQPHSSSIAVNRVTGTEASVLDGALNSNGRVFVINPNGVLFGSGSVVNVGGLLATTFDISDEDFNAGRFIFRDNGRGQGLDAGLVSNAGRITVGIDGTTILDGGEVVAPPPTSDGANTSLDESQEETTARGLAILAGRRVVNVDSPPSENESRPGGTIDAENGQIVLASGAGLTVNMVSFDNGLISYEVTPRTTAAANDLAAIQNSGVLSARGGSVTLLARASSSPPGVGILNNGEIRANGISVDGRGGIYLTSTGGSIESTGTIDASASECCIYEDESDYTPQAVRIESDRSVVIRAPVPSSDESFNGPTVVSAVGTLVNANAGGVPSAGTIHIQGSSVTLSDASITGSSQVRIVATSGDVTGGTGTSVSGSAVGISAAGDAVLSGSYDSFGGNMPVVANLEGALDPGSISIQGATVGLEGASIDAATQARIVSTAGGITSSSSTNVSGNSLNVRGAGNVSLAGTYEAGTIIRPEISGSRSKEEIVEPENISILGATVDLGGAQIIATGSINVIATSGDINALTPSNFVSGRALDIRAAGATKLGGSYQADVESGESTVLFSEAPNAGDIFIQGSDVSLNTVSVIGSGEVRITATSGDVTDFSPPPQNSEGVGSGQPINFISGGALGVKAARNINFGASALFVGNGETFVGGDPSVGDRPGLVEQLRALYQQESVALASPRADGIQLDEIPDSPFPSPSPIYIPFNERPSASFVTGKDGSVQLGGSGGSLSMQGDYLYIQSNAFDFRLAQDVSESSDFQIADIVSPYPLFMQYVPATSDGSVGFEQDLAPDQDLNLSPAWFADYPGATLVFGSTANPVDVVIGDDGPITDGTNGFNYVLAAGPGGLIFNPDGIETDGAVVVLGEVAPRGPRPPIDPPQGPGVSFPSPLPPGQTAEFIAARSQPVPPGAPDVTFDLAAALDTTIQYKSAEGPVLACQ